MAGDDEGVRAIAAQIERYLASHPDAADAPEGIRTWWLTTPLSSRPLDLVVAALEALRKQGVVRCRRGEGVGPIYSRAKSDG